MVRIIFIKCVLSMFNLFFLINYFFVKTIYTIITFIINYKRLNSQNFLEYLSKISLYVDKRSKYY